MRLTFKNDKELIHKITGIVLVNIDNENFGVDELIQETGLSHTVVLHKIKSVTQKTISQFICEIRLQKANEILQNESLTSAEVAYKVGFGSPSYFNTCFHDFFGYTPGEVRKKTNQIKENDLQESIDKPGIKKMMSDKSRPLLFRFSVFLMLMIILWLFHMAFFDNIRKTNTEKNQKTSSIAVLPFKNFSSNNENRYLADGITEGITNQLNKIGNLKVISRTSSEHFRDTKMSIPEIAKELKVDYILEGSVQFNQNKARISVQLINAKKDQQMMSEQFDRELENIFALQSSIVKKVAEGLQMSLTNDEIAKIDKLPTVKHEAVNYYLLGRYFWEKRTKNSLEKSIGYFEKAIEADSLFAQAYAGLANAFFIQAWWGWYLPQKEGYEKAKKYAIEALKLDNELAEAYTVLSGILTWGDWNWEEARKNLKHAIELNPNLSVTHQYYAELLQILDEKEEARLEINQAIELDPISFIHHTISCIGYFYEEKFNESLFECNKVIEINPDHPSAYLTMFYIYNALENDSLAVEAIKKRMLTDTSGISAIPVLEEIFSKTKIDGVIHYLIEQEINKNMPDAFAVSGFYCLLGEKENALNWLELAYKNHSAELPRINVNPVFDILRAEPRFLKIIDEMGLTSYHKRKPKPI